MNNSGFDFGGSSKGNVDNYYTYKNSSSNGYSGGYSGSSGWWWKYALLLLVMFLFEYASNS